MWRYMFGGGGEFNVISCNRGLCESFGLKRRGWQSATNSEEEDEKKETGPDE